MASAAPAPTQEQPKAPSTATALDNVQAMLNLVLITSGRFLKEQTARPSNNGQLTISRTIPAAAERLHIALDELEDDVLQAQVVLRRNLALLKADRRRREAAAKEQEAEKARLAAESSAKKNAPVKKEEPPATAVVIKAQLETSKAGSKPSQSDANPPTLKHDMEALPLPINTSAAQASERDPLFDGTPTTANPQDAEFDFDAMFGDGAMDTSGDGNDQGDFNMDTSGPDLNFTLDDPQPSLLRGLEDFAKSSDDNAGGQPNPNSNPNANASASASVNVGFALSDLPDMSANTTLDQPNTSKPAEPLTTEQTTEQASEQASEYATEQTTEQTADNTTAVDTTNSFLDAMTDNLDDLFNLDEENPEATQFDDAFFGFDES